MSHAAAPTSAERPCIVGRSSSHYTRMARIVALELGVPSDFEPVFDLASRDSADFAGNPALKLPVLRIGEVLAFGTENICRTLAEGAGDSVRIVWTEDLPGVHARNAQELVWHAMQAQVQLVFGTQGAKLPPENIYFAKAAAGLSNTLAWLDANVDALLRALPVRDVSLFEVSLFCLWEHLRFRPGVALEGYPRLAAFAAAFGDRPSARQTAYAFDNPPTA
jgi:glutathione S-transferase